MRRRGKVPFLGLGIDPAAPVVLQILGRALAPAARAHALALAPPDQVNQQAVEQVAHVVLLHARAALAEALDQQDRLQHPEPRFGGEAGVGENLRPQHVVDAHGDLVRVLVGVGGAEQEDGGQEEGVDRGRVEGRHVQEGVDGVEACEEEVAVCL